MYFHFPEGVKYNQQNFSTFPPVASLLLVLLVL